MIPHRLVGQHPVRETESLGRGMCYASATGQPIPNLGEQRFRLITQEGTLHGMTFQAAPVSKALGSVKRMCTSWRTKTQARSFCSERKRATASSISG